jgi:hypothetical protein
MLYLDHGTLGAVTRTKDGGIECPVFFGRTGIQAYTENGREVRALRHPDDVFAADSLATLKHAAITVGHPLERALTSSNWRQHAVGHVSNVTGRVEGTGHDFIAGKLVVQDAATAARVLSGELTEVSCGYFADWDDSAGVYDGEPFTTRQRAIRFNHVALLPPGHGRAGPECRVQLDSADDPLEAAQAAHDARYGVLR